MSVDTGGQWGCWDISTAETGGRCYRTRLCCLFLPLDTHCKHWREPVKGRHMLPRSWASDFLQINAGFSVKVKKVLPPFRQPLPMPGGVWWRAECVNKLKGDQWFREKLHRKHIRLQISLTASYSVSEKMTVEYDGLPGRNQKAQLLK